jgi:hypothetical protein
MQAKFSLTTNQELLMYLNKSFRDWFANSTLAGAANANASNTMLQQDTGFDRNRYQTHASNGISNEVSAFPLHIS